MEKAPGSCGGRSAKERIKRHWWLTGVNCFDLANTHTNRGEARRGATLRLVGNIGNVKERLKAWRLLWRLVKPRTRQVEGGEMRTRPTIGQMIRVTGGPGHSNARMMPSQLHWMKGHTYQWHFNQAAYQLPTCPKQCCRSTVSREFCQQAKAICITNLHHLEKFKRKRRRQLACDGLWFCSGLPDTCPLLDDDPSH